MQIITLPDGLAVSLAKEIDTSSAESADEVLRQCLIKIHVLAETERLIGYTDVQGWRRGGAETFIAIAELSTSEMTRRFIGKALISFVSRPSELVDIWMRRRQLLESKGVRAPKVYAALNGTLYEEYIDHPLPNIGNLPTYLTADLARMVAALDHLGFRPLDFLRDVRVREDQIYYVDFGSDLGDADGVATDHVFKWLLPRLRSDQVAIFEQTYRQWSTPNIF